MKCPMCGNRSNNEEKFCGKCGAPLPKSTKQPKLAEKTATIKVALAGAVQMMKHKKLWRCLALLLLVLVVGGVVIKCLPIKNEDSSYFIAKESLAIFESAIGNHRTVTIAGASGAKQTIEGAVEGWQTSLDGSQAVILIDNDENEWYDGDAETSLWYVTATTKTKIVDDVWRFELASSGEAIVYLVEDEMEDEYDSADLYCYDTVQQKNSKLATNCWAKGGLCISPDGQTIGYATNMSLDDQRYSQVDSFEGYIQQLGQIPEYIGENAFALAVADKGAYVYALDLVLDEWSGELCVYSNGNRIVLGEADTIESFMLNCDYSEILYGLDGQSYISSAGAEGTKVSGSILSQVITPRNTMSKRYFQWTDDIFQVGIRSFADKFAVFDQQWIVRLDDNYRGRTQMATIDENSDSVPQMTQDGRTLYFVNEEDALCQMALDNSEKSYLKLAKDVRNFAVSDDGQVVYYVDDQEGLYYMKNDNKAIKIAGDVEANQMVMVDDSKQLFYLGDEFEGEYTLFRLAQPGGQPEAMLDGVKMLRETVSSVYCIKDKNVYRFNGKNFELFVENIEIGYDSWFGGNL